MKVLLVWPILMKRIARVFIIESTIAEEQVPLSMMSTQLSHPEGGIGVNAVQDIFGTLSEHVLLCP